jgi:hypothetical protein
MRHPSKHYGKTHPAVGAGACPVCGSVAGVPCYVTRSRVPAKQTHIERVKLYERTDAGEGRAGSQEPGE